MDDAKKLAFIASMTAHALQHVAATPNQVTPDGKMSHDKKLAFVQAMTKNGLQHLAGGGTIQSAPNPFAHPIDTAQNVALNPMGGVQALGQGIQGISEALTAQNEFQAQGANITPGTNAAQLADAYSGAQSGLNQQQGVANMLNPGLAQGVSAQSSLSDMLSNEANGVGPNPAQAAYNQNVNNIAAQQAGAISSTKGISPALKAQLISQQGSSALQNAAGQQATLQAQQQLAAQNNLQNLSATQVSQGAGAVQGVNNAQQNEQNILQGANTAANNANVTMQTNLNNVNSATAAQNANAINKTTGGILGGIGAVADLFAKGGMVHRPKMMADGGLMAVPTNTPQSGVGQWINSTPNTSAPSIAAGPAPFESVGAFDKPGSKSGEDEDESGGIGGGGALGDVMAGGAGDELPNIASLALLAAKGGNVSARNINQKASVGGDSLKNDKIPAMLSEGEVVIDRDTLADPGPLGRAAREVAAGIAHRNKSRGKK